MRTVSSVVLGLSTFLAVSSVSLALPQAPPPQRAVPRMGEAYTWRLSFLGSIDGGRARLAIAPPHKNGSSWQINIAGEAEATGFAKAVTGLRYTYKLGLDAASFLPLRMELNETGVRNRTVIVETAVKKINVYQNRNGVEKRWAGSMPSEPLDPVSVLMILRGARMHKGDKLELTLFDGSAFYIGTILVEDRETISTPLGLRPVIRLQCRGDRVDPNGQKTGQPPRLATIWVSDDTMRIPLRAESNTEIGKGVFELTSFEPARKPLPVPRPMRGMLETFASAKAPTPNPVAPAAPASLPPKPAAAPALVPGAPPAGPAASAPTPAAVAPAPAAPSTASAVPAATSAPSAAMPAASAPTPAASPATPAASGTAPAASALTPAGPAPTPAAPAPTRGAPASVPGTPAAPSAPVLPAT